MAISRTVQFDSPEQTAIYAAKLAKNLAHEDIILYANALIVFVYYVLSPTFAFVDLINKIAYLSPQTGRFRARLPQLAGILDC